MEEFLEKLTVEDAGRVLSKVLKYCFILYPEDILRYLDAFCGRQIDGLCSRSVMALQLKNELKY